MGDWRDSLIAHEITQIYWNDRNLLKLLKFTELLKSTDFTTLTTSYRFVGIPEIFKMKIWSNLIIQTLPPGLYRGTKVWTTKFTEFYSNYWNPRFWQVKLFWNRIKSKPHVGRDVLEGFARVCWSLYSMQVPVNITILVYWKITENYWNYWNLAAISRQDFFVKKALYVLSYYMPRIDTQTFGKIVRGNNSQPLLKVTQQNFTKITEITEIYWNLERSERWWQIFFIKFHN